MVKLSSYLSLPHKREMRGAILDLAHIFEYWENVQTGKGFRLAAIIIFDQPGQQLPHIFFYKIQTYEKTIIIKQKGKNRTEEVSDFFFVFFWDFCGEGGWVLLYVVLTTCKKYGFLHPQFCNVLSFSCMIGEKRRGDSAQYVSNPFLLPFPTFLAFPPSSTPPPTPQNIKF